MVQGYTQSCGTGLHTKLWYRVTHKVVVQGYTQSCGTGLHKKLWYRVTHKVVVQGYTQRMKTTETTVQNFFNSSIKFTAPASCKLISFVAKSFSGYIISRLYFRQNPKFNPLIDRFKKRFWSSVMSHPLRVTLY